MSSNPMTPAQTIECAFAKCSSAMTRARTIFNDQSSAPGLRADAAANAAEELLEAINLFMQALPHVQDQRANALMRRNVASLLDDSARLREIANGVSSDPSCDSSVCELESATTSNDDHRRRIVEELLSTERSYCASLCRFVRVFALPLKPSNDDDDPLSPLKQLILDAVGASPPTNPSDLLSTSEHELLFSAVEQLLPLNQRECSSVLLSLYTPTNLTSNHFSDA